MMIVTVGYTEYAVSSEDAIQLLEIAERARPVKRSGYGTRDPWILRTEADPFVSEARIGTVIEDADYIKPIAEEPAVAPPDLESPF